MPSHRGRVLAGLIGLAAGSYVAFDSMKDYELIKRVDDPNERDENGEPIKRKLKVTFQPTQPLKLKPEAEQRERKKWEDSQQQQQSTDNKP